MKIHVYVTIWHAYIEEATEMGLPVIVGLPHSIYDLIDLYPQPQGGQPSVQYIHIPYNDRRSILPIPKGKPLEEPNQMILRALE